MSKNKTLPKSISMKRKVVSVLLEIIYICFNLCFLLYFYNNYIYGSGVYTYDFNNRIFCCLIIILIIISIIIIPPLNRLFSFIYTFSISLYLIAQKIYYNAFGQFFRLKYAFSLLSEVAGVKSSVEEFISTSDFVPLIILAVVNLISLLLYFLLERRIFSFKTIMIKTIVCILISVGLFSYIPKTIKEIDADVLRMNNDYGQFLFTDDYYLYTMFENNNDFVDKFGIYTFLYRDINSIFENKELTNEEIAEIDNLLSSRYNLKENDYTGIFDGKNVLFVQAESLMNIAIDKELTPTLYEIANNGISVKNFNTPLLAASTSDTELMANISWIPNSSEEASCYQYANNYFPTTLAKVFKNKGYITSAYHNNYAEYYNRGELFKTLGYDSFLDSYELGIESTSEDSIAVEKIAWCMAMEKNNYMDYWITFSGHQPYSYDSYGVKEEYVERIKEKYPNLSENYVSYLAKAMDLDVALKNYLLIHSYFHNLDNMVIVLYGDHYAKGLDFKNDSAFYQQTNKEWKYDDTYTGLYIYDNGVHTGTIDKVSTVLDLLPTMANMFKLDIDNKTILGKDIFDDNYNGLFFSETGTWRDNTYTYENGEYKKTNGTFITEDESIEAKKVIKEYQRNRELSFLILKNDYFNNNK